MWLSAVATAIFSIFTELLRNIPGILHWNFSRNTVVRICIRNSHIRSIYKKGRSRFILKQLRPLFFSLLYSAIQLSIPDAPAYFSRYFSAYSSAFSSSSPGEKQ